MNLADVRAEVEDELTWRLDEIRFFRNQLSRLSTTDEQDRYRKALVVMLYSHFEGFWRAAFSIYIKTINDEGVACEDACDAIAAASLFEILAALVDWNRKCDFFRRAAPDDNKLHQAARHAEFVGRIHDVQSTRVNIPAERVVDTESNLNPVVVRKNLFRLGFKHDMFASHEGTINELLGRRNAIAHGSSRSGVTSGDYSKLESSVTAIMQDIVHLVFDSLREKWYLRPT